MFGRHSASLLQIAQDRKLVRKLLTGDEKAFRAFVDEYFPKIYRYAKCQLQNNEDVEEVVQSALSNAAKNLDKYRGEATLLTWLIQICRNEINHTYRRMAKQDVAKPYLNDDVLRSVIESLAAPVEENPDARFARNELISFIQFALDQLPETYAKVLEMKYVEGYSSREIAEKLETSDEATQSMLARARQAFREVCNQAAPHLVPVNSPNAQ